MPEEEEGGISFEYQKGKKSYLEDHDMRLPWTKTLWDEAYSRKGNEMTLSEKLSGSRP